MQGEGEGGERRIEASMASRLSKATGTAWANGEVAVHARMSTNVEAIGAHGDTDRSQSQAIMSTSEGIARVREANMLHCLRHSKEAATAAPTCARKRAPPR